MRLLLLLQFARTVLFGLTAVGIAYHLVSLAACMKFAFTRARKRSRTPGISLLKPVRGVDPDAYDNFASFCRQSYPEYEVLFGVQDPADPAVELVERLQRDFPEAGVRLVVSGHRIGPNLKICNLHNLLGHASHDLLVISDSDMRVGPDYLRQIAAYFEDPQVGMVTSPYRGVGAKSVAAGLEALGMATEFFPGVAVASQFASPGFALGSTMALRRETLKAIGGFEDLSHYLADDFQMGRRVARSGVKVAFSRYVVDTVLPNIGFGAMWSRRLRWTRTVRTCQPGGFAGSLVTHSTVWALALLLACGGSAWPLGVLGAQQAVRWATALLIAGGALRSRDALRWLWLLPASDLLNFGLWLGSWFGGTVLWRGDRYRLTGGGRMERITEEARVVPGWSTGPL